MGLTNPEIDAAINAAIDGLLRDLRGNTRGKEVLDADSAEIATLKQATAKVATGLRQAAGLFDG